MGEIDINTSGKVKAFFQEKIRDYREGYEDLDDVEKMQLLKIYQHPCQIEIFWISEPVEYQLILIYHDNDRDDGEIRINGPYIGNEFINKVVEDVKDERWMKKAPHSKDDFDTWYDQDVGNQEGKYSDYLLRPLSHFINTIKIDPLSQIKKGAGERGVIKNHDLYVIVKGNVAELDNDELSYLDPIHYAKRFAKYERAQKNDVILQVEPTHPNEVNRESVIGSYFYPHMRIGDDVELTFYEKLIDIIGQPHILPEAKYFFEKRNFDGFYDTFGFIGIRKSDEKKVIKILNTIYGVACLFGFQFLSVREPELMSGFLNLETQYFGGLSYYENNRTKGLSSYGKRQVHLTHSEINKIISTVDAVWIDENLNEWIQFFQESRTHQYNKEFAQSFIYSWLIAEKHLIKQFNSFLKDRDISRKRRDKFTSFDKWTTESKIEILNLVEKIDNKQYKFLIDNNTTRNNIVHSGHSVTEEESSALLNYTQILLKEEISALGIPLE